MRQTIGYFTALLAITTGALLAQPGGDPPSRVARLNYLNGTVSFRPGSVEEWAAASLNYPLTTGDHLFTDANSQTELHVGSTAIRMDQQTALAFINLDDRVAQLSLTGGSLNVRIRSLRPDEVYEVDTPNAAIVLRQGDYGINSDGDRNTTMVLVREGQADITGGGANFPVYPRQMANISGTDQLRQEIVPMGPPDGFDAWCAQRERGEQSVVSARYVPRDMIGYEDLDAYGVWRNVPPYGMVWTPTSMAAGWAPYHNGHWAWVEPWGWTWIDEAPWGFAPFHYGRWAFAGGAWLWVPGRMDVAVRPVYAPALVAFVGGPRFGVAIAVGGGGGMAAWFPLGPGEVYRPAYHVSDVYVRQINIVHVNDVTVINRVDVANVHYANQAVPGAVMAVPHDAFVSARPVAGVAVRVDAREVAGAPVMATAAFAPRRESVLGGEVRTNAPPARFVQHQVVMKSPAPPPPVSFAAKQKALEANGGRPLDENTMRTLRSNAPPPATPAMRNNNVAPARNDRPPNKEVAAPKGEEHPAVKTEPQTPAARKAEEHKPEPPAKNNNKKATRK